ncbi:MAG: glycosyltransferase [Candidatus Omnitrophica bacterium]|nr:glycosyltransferase [Candidatus Omnitrophota bacterium]MBU4478990.1 glycosyltransferase [Candidatus Omnitrophota bacterium]
MKVKLILWSDPRAYLAIMSTTQILSKRGIDVEVLYRTPASHMDVAGKVDFGSKARLRPIGGGHTGWRDKLDFIIFLFKAIVSVLHDRPDAVIGYNRLGIMAAFLATRLRPKTALIYHNFDFNTNSKKNSPMRKKFFQLLELAGARHADLVIFPHAERAAVFKSEAQLDRDPITVMNCYFLSTPKQKTGELQRLLGAKGLRFDRLVIRLGMIGPYHGIEATIRSVLEWEGNWGLILAGFPDEGSYIDEMQKLVNSLGLTKRVLFLPSVSYSLWYDCLYSAHLGISLYEPFNLSHSYMSGTSQKLNNYFVAGIPSIVSNSPDFVTFVERFGTSKIADPADPHSIAEAVNSILSNSEEYSAYCRNVRSAFESEFNFEKQFEPVLNWLVNEQYNTER